MGTGNRGSEVWPKVQTFEVALPCLGILTLEGLHDGAERWPIWVFRLTSLVRIVCQRSTKCKVSRNDACMYAFDIQGVRHHGSPYKSTKHHLTSS